MDYSRNLHHHQPLLQPSSSCSTPTTTKRSNTEAIVTAPTGAATASTITATASSTTATTYHHHGFCTLNPNNNTQAILSTLIPRLVFAVFVILIALWATHEALKGFEIRILNDNIHSVAGQKFDLYYVSDDEITRLVLKSSDFVTKILYPATNYGNSSKNIIRKKKHVSRVIIRLASKDDFPNIRNGGDQQHYSHHNIVPRPFGKKYEYLLNISPSVIEASNFRYVMRKAVLQGMVEIWLNINGDGVDDQKFQKSMPRTLVEGIIEYVSLLAGVSNPVLVNNNIAEIKGEIDGKYCWENQDPKFVAKFLSYCERKSTDEGGFIGRLNEAMADGWYQGILNDVLGMSATEICQSFCYLHSQSRQG